MRMREWREESGPEKSSFENAPLRLASTVDRITPPGFMPRNHGYFRGLVTEIEGNMPDGGLKATGVYNDANEPQREVALRLEVVEAAEMHDTIMAATGASNEVDFQYEGLEMVVGVRYTHLPDLAPDISQPGNYLSVMAASFFVGYDQDYRSDPRFEEAHNLLMATLLKDVKPQDPDTYYTNIDVGYGGTGTYSWQPTQEVLDIIAAAQ
jgi:hypothetical protein